MTVSAGDDAADGRSAVEPFQLWGVLRNDPAVRYLSVAGGTGAASLAGYAVASAVFDAVPPVLTGGLFALPLGGVLAVTAAGIVAVTVVSPTTRQAEHWTQLRLEAAKLDELTTESDAGDARADDSAGSEAPAPGDRLRIARNALDAGRQAVYRRDYVTAAESRYTASRLRFRVESQRENLTESVSQLERRLRSFAGECLPARRRRLVETHLSDDDTAIGVYYAMKTLHEWNVSRLERLRAVRRYFWLAIWACVVVLSGIVAVVALGEIEYVNGGGFSSSFEPAVAGIVFGTAGAVTSILYSGTQGLGDRTSDPSIPEPKYIYEALLTRVLVGAVFGLVAVIISQTAFAEGVFDASVTTGGGELFVLAFLAGFSDQVFKDRLDAFTQSALGRPVSEQTPPTSGSPDEPSGPDELRDDPGGGVSDDGEQPRETA